MAPKSDSIMFNGVKFIRFPESKNLTHRSYYRPHSSHVKRGIGALHQEIWKSEYGEVPDGYEIHHLDMDTLNNKIENLTCILVKEHHKIHYRAWAAIPGNREKQLAQLDSIRGKAAAWHSSPEGIEWHKQHARKLWNNPKMGYLTCNECGKEFTSPRGNTKYCSPKCAEQYNRKHDKRKSVTCVICNTEFKTYVKSTAKTCSEKCRVEKILRTRRG